MPLCGRRRSAITEPGDAVQLDFAHLGKLLDPISMAPRKTWVFVGVLGYSRRTGAMLVFDQRLETWVRLRVETWVRLRVEMFEALDGVPHAGTDNLEAAVIRAALTAKDETSIDRGSRELARHDALEIDPTRPRAPGKTGGLRGFASRDDDGARASSRRASASSRRRSSETTSRWRSPTLLKPQGNVQAILASGRGWRHERRVRELILRWEAEADAAAAGAPLARRRGALRPTAEHPALAQWRGARDA